MGVDQLLRNCTVRITVPNRNGWGTGFFVAPGLILTCEHVVRHAIDDKVNVYWHKTTRNYAAKILKVASDNKTLDFALIQLKPAFPEHSCVYLDQSSILFGEDHRITDPLYGYGYLQKYKNGAGINGESEGYTGDHPPLIKFKDADVQRGISGGALFNIRTSKVIGIIKETRSLSYPKGGTAIPISVVYQNLYQFVDLQHLQTDFHKRNRQWEQYIGEPNKKLPKLESPFLNSNRTTLDFIFNYIFTLCFLIGVLITWFFTGIWAKAEFPIAFVLDLIKACIRGPKEFSKNIDIKKNTFLETEIEDLKDSNNHKYIYLKLSEYESQAQVLSVLIDRLYGQKLVLKFEDKRVVAKIKQELRDRRDLLWVDLAPLREVYDPYLRKIEDFFYTAYADSSIAVEDYHKIQMALDAWVKRFTYESASEETTMRLLKEISVTIRQNPYFIRKSRLRSLESTFKLLKWIAILNKSSQIQEALNQYAETLSSDTVDITENKPQEKSALDHEATLIEPSYMVTTPLKEEERTSWLERIFHHLEHVMQEIYPNAYEYKTCIEIFKKGIENGWIERLIFHGVRTQANLYNSNSVNLVSNVKFTLSIGWDGINRNQDFPVIQEEDFNIDDQLSAFSKFLELYDLSFEWRVQYTTHVNNNRRLKAHVDLSLDLKDAEPMAGERIRAGIYREADTEIPSFQCELNFENPESS